MAEMSTPSPPAPIITLTTDFGLRDPFVGIMKGVILGLCRTARLVDLTHDISPQDVMAGQIALESATRFFPPGSVHLAVVDPGVGGSRRPLALSAGGHYFVGPDNGLFTFALSTMEWSAVSLEAPAYHRPEVSQTFHGRDIFAPAAAHLAIGEPLGRLGPPVIDPVRLPLPVARMDGDWLVGQVIGVDRFGNLLTSVTAADLARLGGAGAHLEVEIAGKPLGALVLAYVHGRGDAPAPIVGSSGRIEIFVREGSAREALGADRGSMVRVRTR